MNSAVVKFSHESQPFRLSVVVPAYNEALVIERFLCALSATALALTPDVQIIVVNDGSSDGTGAIVAGLTGSLPVDYIELSRNFGKEAALQAGLDAASGDCVVMMDADFQHPLEMIPTMVERWRTGVDMVYTRKASRKAESLLHRVGARIFYRLVNNEQGATIPPDAGDFRLLDRRVVKALRELPERNRFMKGLYAWVGFRSEGLPITVGDRAAGESKFSRLRLAGLAITGVTAFSVAPLRFLTLAGIVISICSMLMGSWIVGEKLLLGQPIQGFSTLGAAIFFLSGVQLVSIGIVGEYIGRIFDEVKQRPPYLVSRKIWNGQDSQAQHLR